jgi:hypothetical protein
MVNGKLVDSQKIVVAFQVLAAVLNNSFVF